MKTAMNRTTETQRLNRYPAAPLHPLAPANDHDHHGAVIEIQFNFENFCYPNFVHRQQMSPISPLGLSLTCRLSIPSLSSAPLLILFIFYRCLHFPDTTTNNPPTPHHPKGCKSFVNPLFDA